MTTTGETQQSTSKKIYEEKAEAQLRVWRAELDKMRAKADMKKADAKADYQDIVSKLTERRDRAQSQLDRIKNSSGDAWKDLKSGMDSALNELKSAIDTASARF